MLDTPTAPSEPLWTAVPDASGANFWTADPVFPRLLALYLDPAMLALITPHLDRLGRLAGSSLDELASLADRNPPTLVKRTRRGEDIDAIEYHPAYRRMEELAFKELGLASMSHRAGTFGADKPLPPVVKYAFTFLFAQSEFGLLCPVSMTDSLARTLKRYGSPELVERYLPRMGNQDPGLIFQGAMFMTEQGAGSDISATAAMARKRDDGTWALSGEKWFCSNPDCDVSLVLARREGGPAGMRGVSLFLLPKVLPDGRRNSYRIIRLKDKLGTRCMASGEVDLNGATAWLVGDPEAGFKQMADMVNNSRLSNGVRAAGLMHRAVFEALHVARNRVAFNKRLIEMPLMQRQLVKMLMVAEQARTMVFQTGDTMAQADAGNNSAGRLLRILTPLLKYRACRDARKVTGDAMEVRGGCGYIEEFPEPRLLRDSHLGSIWEGTSNIVALDVIRAIRREEGLDAWTHWVDGLLEEAPLDGAADCVKRARALAIEALKRDELARSAAAALYNVGTAAAMNWEAKRIGDAARAHLARLVLTHRVLPRDPLETGETDTATIATILAAVG